MILTESRIRNGWHSNPMSRQSSYNPLSMDYKPRTTGAETDSEPNQPRDGFNKPRPKSSDGDQQPRDGQ